MGALLGTVIGGLLALGGVYLTDRKAYQRERRLRTLTARERAYLDFLKARCDHGEIWDEGLHPDADPDNFGLGLLPLLTPIEVYGSRRVKDVALRVYHDVRNWSDEVPAGNGIALYRELVEAIRADLGIED